MAKKRKKTKKRNKKATKVPVRLHPVGLHNKKIEIMNAVPIMPCSALGKDRQGLRFAHTQAERVYQIYREECSKRGLTVRRVKGETKDSRYCYAYTTDKGDWKFTDRACVRYEGVWEIRDNETGQTETFGGAGDGDNEIWSSMSAQTNAKKQALLDYFETAWPQPTDHLRVIRESLQKVPKEQLVEAIKQILPEPAYKVLATTGAWEALESFFNQTSQERKSKK